MTLLPDEPRWVEANAIADDPASWRARGIVGSDSAQLMVIVDDKFDAAALRDDFTILTANEAIGRALGAHRAIIHTLDEPEALPDFGGAMVLPAETSLAHLPADLAAELARTTSPIFAAWIDGIAVAFAYAPWRTPAWFDVSIDVLPGARQLGIGSTVAAAMIREESIGGRAPVWGADEHNTASLRLAQRLGFVPVDELWLRPPVTS